MSDSVIELVNRARSGDQAAWEAIVERYAPLVWSMCRRFGLSRADADDVGACVWLRLVEALDTIREPAALPGWLQTTTRRECLYLLRAKDRQVLVGDDERIVDESAPDAAVDKWLLEQERQVALRVAFAGLSEQCRRLLSMLFADPPAPYTQVSAELGMAVGAVGPSRQRCLAKLRASPALAAFLQAEPADMDSR